MAVNFNFKIYTLPDGHNIYFAEYELFEKDYINSGMGTESGAGFGHGEPATVEQLYPQSDFPNGEMIGLGYGTSAGCGDGLGVKSW